MGQWHRRQLALTSHFLAATGADISSFVKFTREPHWTVSHQVHHPKKLGDMIKNKRVSRLENLSSYSCECRGLLTVENDFFEFLKIEWLQFTGEVDKFINFWCEISSWFRVPRMTKTSSFWLSYCHDKRGWYLNDSVATVLSVVYSTRGCNVKLSLVYPKNTWTQHII